MVISGYPVGLHDWFSVSYVFSISLPPLSLNLTHMKIQKKLLTAVLAAALSVSAFAQKNKGPTAWVFSKAVVTKQGLKVPPTAGAVNVLTFTTGATVARDAEAPGGKVVVLDGTQTAPGISLRTLNAMDAFLIKLSFKPAVTGGERQTLLRLASSELRYNRMQARLEFIVWHGDPAEQKFVNVTVPVKAGACNAVSANYEAGKLTLTVGKVTNTVELPAGAMVPAVPAGVRVGFANDRPYSGSISELSIGAPN